MSVSIFKKNILINANETFRCNYHLPICSLMSHWNPWLHKPLFKATKTSSLHLHLPLSSLYCFFHFISPSPLSPLNKSVTKPIRSSWIVQAAHAKLQPPVISLFKLGLTQFAQLGNTGFEVASDVCSSPLSLYATHQTFEHFWSYPVYPISTLYLSYFTKSQNDSLLFSPLNNQQSVRSQMTLYLWWCLSPLGHSEERRALGGYTPLNPSPLYRNEICWI